MFEIHPITGRIEHAATETAYRNANGVLERSRAVTQLAVVALVDALGGQAPDTVRLSRADGELTRQLYRAIKAMLALGRNTRQSCIFRHHLPTRET